MILLECSPPFQWRPSLRGFAGGWRAMWGWLAVAWVPYDLNGFVEGLAEAGADLAREQIPAPGGLVAYGTKDIKPGDVAGLL